MDTQILKLDKPYNYIYCNGSIGLHIATLIVYEAKVNENGEYQLETHSHPVVRYQNSPDGTVWNKAELRNCEVICSESDKRVPLERIRTILYYQSKSEEEKTPGFALNAMFMRSLEALGIEVIWPVDKDGNEITEFDVRLTLTKIEKKPYRCQSANPYFFFYAEARTVNALHFDLDNARSRFKYTFPDHQFTIKFFSNDPRCENLIKRLNNE